MGDWKRTILFALAIVGLAASLLMPWWRAEFIGSSIEVTLREIEVCSQGICATVKAPGSYGIVGMMAFVYGWIAVLALILGGLVPSLTGENTKARAYAAAILYPGVAGMAYITLDFPPELARLINLQSTWWFWIGLGSSALVLASPMLRLLEPRRAPPPPLYKLPIADGLPEARALPARRAPVNAISLPGQEPPVAAPTLVERSGLRFALSTSEAHAAALLTVGEDGRIRELPWSRIGGALARELTVQPRLDDALLVDLIPRGEPPLRFLATTRIQFPGAEPAVGRDAMRRLLAYARAMNPELQVETSTADFLYKRTELPAWSPTELADYDSRYS